MRNLIRNAAEANTQNIDIEIIFGEPIVITIQDDGDGTEAIEQIFDPFFTTKDDGTGLGLSIVHHIVLDHQGGISVHKSDDKGTVFRLVFPKLLRPKNARSSG